MIAAIYENILSRPLFRHISTVFIWDIVGKLIGVITTILLIRALPKNDYALYTFFYAAGALFIGVIANGIDMAYVRFASEEYSRKREMPNDIFIFSIFLCLFFYIVLTPIILSFRTSLSELMFRDQLFSSPLLLGFFFSFPPILTIFVTRYYQVQERYKRAGVLFSLDKFVFLFFLLSFVFISQSLSFMKIAVVQVVLSFVFGIFLISYTFRQGINLAKLDLQAKRFFYFIGTSFWLILYFVCLAIFGQLGVFMISRMMTIGDLANYGVAFRYYSLIMLLFPAIKTVLKVHTAKIDFVDNFEKQKQFLSRWIKLTSLLAIPLALMILFFSGYFMNLVNGAQYSGAILPFKISAISALISYIFSPNTDLFRTMNKHFLMFCFGFFALIINFLINYILIPIYGISGVAFSNLISFFIVNGLATVYIFSRKTCVSSVRGTSKTC